MNDLSGRRILVVEDEALVAAMVAGMLEDLGAQVVGPVGTVAKGLALAEEADLDAAVLDVNLRGERIDPVAEALERRGIGFVFATGYGVAPAGPWADVPILDKPYTVEALAGLLCSIIERRR